MTMVKGLEVRDQAALRASFNALTQKTFGFDFTDWYARGHWREQYLPHVWVEDQKVVSNVSVNRMQFRYRGDTKRLIQLGTVMTDPEYRGRGLNRRLMEAVLAEYLPQSDGIYLFGNDSVLDYYPKFGFVPAREAAFSRRVTPNAQGYALRRVDLSRAEEAAGLEAAIQAGSAADGFFLTDNLGLYQFWLAIPPYGEQVYFLPEVGDYVLAQAEGPLLQLFAAFGPARLDLSRLAASFGPAVQKVSLGFTPACREGFAVKDYREEDCTLFVLGKELETLLQTPLRFPLLSHA